MNSRKSYQKLIRVLILIIILGGNAALAQEYNEEVTIIGSYTPTINDANKINFSPQITLGEQHEMPVLSYSIHSTKINTRVELEPIKPSTKVAGQTYTKLYRSYIKAGYGNYNTPFVEFFVNSLRNEESQFGLHMKHLSSSGQVHDDYGKSAFSRNYAKVFGKQFFKNSTMSGHVTYKRDVVHYYGFVDTLAPEKDTLPRDDDIKQRYQLFGGELALTSNNENKKALAYRIGFNPYYYGDKFESYETMIGFDVGLSKGLELFGRNISTVGISADLDYYLFSDSVNNINNGVSRINPYFNLNFGQYQLKLGFTTAFGFNTDSNLDFFPDIVAKVHVLPGYLTVFAGFSGSIEKASFYSLSQENPFITSIVPMKFTRNKMEIYGGINGNIEEAVDFSIRVSNTSVENMPFFVTDTLNMINNMFTVIYDNGSVTRVSFEIGYQYTENLRLALAIMYNNYNLDSLQKTLQKPEMMADLELNYVVSEKFLLKTALIYYGKQYAQLYDFDKHQYFDKPETIDGYFDINLGAEYRFRKNLSFFIDLHNIANQQYQKWYNYPAQEFNFLAGLTYSF